MTILTLRLSNGTAANLGNVAIQPVANATTSAAPNRAGSTSTPPTRQVTLSQQVLSQAKGAVVRFSPSLSALAAGLSLTSTSGKKIIPLHLAFGAQTPSYNISLNAGKEYDPRLNQGFVGSTVKFQPYEQLTGISQDRPEVVMVTCIQPLFTSDIAHTAPNFLNLVESSGIYPYMTDAGRYIDAQFDMRNVRVFNVQQLISNLRAKYPNIDQAFAQRESDMGDALARLNVDASFLLNLVRVLEVQKSQLDLRHDIYTVDLAKASNLLTAASSNSQTQAAFPAGPTGNSQLPHSPWGFLAPKYDFVDTLTEFGYTMATVQTVYSSTKVWMQTLLELSYALKYHTPQFLDIDPSYQRKDNNPTTILNPPITRFRLSVNLPNLPPLTEVINLQQTQVTATINVIKPAFQTIYQNVFFKNEEARIAALAHLLSTEYRYSYGLTLPAAQQALSKYYGYTVVQGQGNSTVFDAVVGKFGNNITDFPAQNTNSLVAVAQQASGQTGVLTFESKYVEGDTGTLTPGSDFYFGQVLNTDGKAFNTANIDGLLSNISNTLLGFNLVVNNLNLMSNTTYVPGPNGTQSNNASLLTSTNDLISRIRSNLLDANGQTSTLLQNDRLAPVFIQARKNPTLKAALFLYFMAKISRNYTNNVPFFTSSAAADNTPTVNYLIDQVNLYLASSVPQTTASATQLQAATLNEQAPLALNPNSLKAALTSGTSLTGVVELLLSLVLAQFQVNTRAIVGGFTQYGGYIDTSVMMVAFDLIVSMIALYSNRSVVSLASSPTLFSIGGFTYVVSTSSTDHSASSNELTQRALGEDYRLQQLLLTVTSTLTTLQGSLQGLSNYLKSPPATTLLQEVAGIVGNDPQLLQMLLNEQQVMLLAATAQNILQGSQQPLGGQQPNSTNGFNDNEEIKVLDGSNVTPALRDALLSYFGTPDLATSSGANKRILTVGIPQGLSQRIKQRVNIQDQQRASFQNRRNDLVSICVYKVDMINSDIVYKPQRFLFELARFPARLATSAWLPLPQQPTVADIVNAIPTLNFSTNLDTDPSTSITSGLEYAPAVVAGADGVQRAQVAFADDSYSFLTANQKAEILHNHVVSQLLEAYIRMMTGIDVAEYSFDMSTPPSLVETDFVQSLVAHQVQYIADIKAKGTSTANTGAPVGGIMFSTTVLPTRSPPSRNSDVKARSGIGTRRLTNASGVAGSVDQSILLQDIQSAAQDVKALQQTSVVGGVDNNLDAVSPRDVSLVVESLRTIGSFSNTVSTASDPSAVNQKVVLPKQFDRVFSIVVDPSDFEVDVDQTTSTPYGRAALDLMVASGDIVPATENDQAVAQASTVGNQPTTPGSRPLSPGSPAPNVGAYRYRDRDTNQGDLTADKYFVTIETLDEGT